MVYDMVIQPAMTYGAITGINPGAKMDLSS